MMIHHFFNRGEVLMLWSLCFNFIPLLLPVALRGLLKRGTIHAFNDRRKTEQNTNQSMWKHKPA